MRVDRLVLWGSLGAALAFACSGCSESGDGGSEAVGTGGTGAGNGSGGALGSSTGGASTGGSTVTSGGSGGASGTSGGTAGGGGSGGGSGGGGAGGGASGSGGAGGSAGGEADPTCGIGVHDPPTSPQMLNLTGDTIHSHDPVIIQSGTGFISYSTGDNLLVKTSPDLLDWRFAGEIFDGTPDRPAWLSENVPGVMNLWAPDISEFGGAFHLYYSVSTLYSSRSCIGHATRTSLDSGGFVDRGPLLCSDVDTNEDFNAIDPNVIIDRDGAPWLVFGSFSSGIELVRLGPSGDRADDVELNIATGPVEAPFIVWRCGYYYLFVSRDACCLGVDSTYNIRVGRSAQITGPYVDESGTAMTNGGGTLLVSGNDQWRGPGHNAVLFVGTRAYNVYHSYNASDAGRPYLRIAELVWNTEGWPISAGP
jgi:arabinan endo-1,5-alpha-L-arabinosidase